MFSTYGAEFTERRIHCAEFTSFCAEFTIFPAPNLQSRRIHWESATMSKLSFRARALDATKPMAVYKAEEIPNILDYAAINRTVPQMPTGMEKEEESEHHLQRALSTQQVYGQAEVIPVPEIDIVNEQRYERLYRAHDAFKPPKQYVHVQAFGVEQEIPDYDMDSEDETWLNKQAKKMEVTPIQFENMMDRLEKGSGQMVVTLQEAKALLKEDDDLIIAVYDYWLNKRLNKQQRLIPQVKTEKRDGSSSSDPYVAFRRRTEKMQTRKNRKNDETSYEKMLKLRRDLNKALTILELMKRREKSKKELLQLTIEIFEKRYQMQDWTGVALQEALAKRHTLPSFIPIQPPDIKWGRGETTAQAPRKRYQPRKPKKHKAPKIEPQRQLPQYSEVDIPNVDQYSSEDEGLSPVSPSDQETDDDPDGIYAFRRKANCSYHAPITDGFGDWPWSSPEEGGLGEKRFRFSLLSLSQPRRCVGFSRRRIGRGGRVWIDRGYSEWDDQLTQMDFTSSPPAHKSYLSDLQQYIKDHKIPHFRPQTPTEEDSNGGGSLSPTSVHSSDFNAESFQWHQEQLLAMQRHQQEELLKQESSELDSSFDLDHSFSSQPTSRFTLDKATARFAASAVCNSTQELLTQNPVTLPKPPTSSFGGTSSNNTSSTVITTAAVTATSTSRSNNGSQQSSTSSFSSVLAASLSSSQPLSSSSAASSSLPASITSSLTNGPSTDLKNSGLSTSPQASVLTLNYPLTMSTPSNDSGSNNHHKKAQSKPVIGPKATAVTTPASSSTPALLKLPQSHGSHDHANSIIASDNHDGVSRLKEQSVAMEVT